MNFNKTTEYSLRILSYMALNENELHSAEHLFEKLSIPKKYLQRLLTDLCRSGFIKSTRGRNGGFSFARPINQIYLSEIISSTELLEKDPKCLFGFGVCVLDKTCALHDIWAESHNNMIKVLASTRLSDLKKT